LADALRSEHAESAPTSSPIPVRYLVLAGLCLASTIAYIHRGMLAVPAKSIGAELQITDDQMGWILSGFFWTYAFGQIPSAWLGERFGSRRMLPVYAILWSLAAGGLGLFRSYQGLLACQLLCGLGQAGIFPCAVQTLAVWFPKTERAFASGLLGGFMQTGSVVASLLIAFLLRYSTWPTVFLALSTLGLVWAAVFYVWFRDRPEEHPQVTPAELEEIRAGWTMDVAEATSDNPPVDRKPATPWGAILTSPVMLLIAGQQFFRAAGTVFYATWFPTYLQETRGVSTEHSGYYSGLALMGVVVGSLVGGWISDVIYRQTGSLAVSRKGISVAGAIGCGLCLLLAYFVDDPLIATVVIAAGSFSSGIASPTAYAITMDLGGKNVSTVFSLMNMSGNVGAALSPKLVNWLVKACGGAWAPVLFMYAGIYFAAAFCWVLINPHRPVVATQDQSM
jgi:sugar phosphate permease